MARTCRGTSHSSHTSRAATTTGAVHTQPPNTSARTSPARNGIPSVMTAVTTRTGAKRGETGCQVMPSISKAGSFVMGSFLGFAPRLPSIVGMILRASLRWRREWGAQLEAGVRCSPNRACAPALEAGVGCSAGAGGLFLPLAVVLLVVGWHPAPVLGEQSGGSQREGTQHPRERPQQLFSWGGCGQVRQRQTDLGEEVAQVDGRCQRPGLREDEDPAGPDRVVHILCPQGAAYP